MNGVGVQVFSYLHVYIGMYSLIVARHLPDIKQRVPAFWAQRRAFFLLWNSERMDQATARISKDNPTVNRELQANVITKEREREKKNLILCKTQIKTRIIFNR